MGRCRRFRDLVVAAAVAASALSSRDAHADDPPPAAPPAADAPPGDEVAALRKRVEALEKRLDEWPVRLSGYAQVDWVAMSQSSQNEINWSTGQPLNEERFTLRRGHLRAEAERGLVSGALEIDANTTNGPQVRPIDAEVRIGWPKPQPGESRGPWFDGTLGLMKIPFGFEVPELDNVRPFLERANVMRALFPGEFDLGVRLRGRWRWLEYAVALMNGHPIGEVGFPGRAPLNTKDMVARVGVDTEIVPGLRFVAGASGVTGTGFHEGTPPTKDQLVWRDVNEDGIVQPTEIQVLPGQAATASQQFHRFALGGDVRLLARIAPLGELAVRAELVWGTNMDRAMVVADPIASGRDVREVGWYVGATQELGRWFALGVRYDRYDPDADATNQRGPRLVPQDLTFSTLALMFMVHTGLQRLVFEYDKNGNALGIDPTGAPTTLASDTLTVRGQVSF